MIKTINIKNNRGSKSLLECKEEETINQITLIDLMLDHWLQVKTTGYLGLWIENEVVSLGHILIINFGIVGSVEV